MMPPRLFSYDPAKRVRNLSERGIDFENARAFEFATAIVSVDDRKEYGERREIAAGFIADRLHILVFTMRVETCHVISLRKANAREIGTYAEKAAQLE